MHGMLLTGRGFGFSRRDVYNPLADAFGQWAQGILADS